MTDKKLSKKGSTKQTTKSKAVKKAKKSVSKKVKKETKPEVAKKTVAKKAIKTSSKRKKMNSPSEDKKSVSKNKSKSETKGSDIRYPSLQEMLEAGAHFGHKTSRWNPKMEKYIFDVRNNIHIIDLTQTLGLLRDAVEFLSKVSQEGNILLVGTKGQAATLVKNAGMDHGALYISRRWPGGLLTNFKNIKKSINKLMQIEENLASRKGYETKKEMLVMEKDRDRLKKMYEGIMFMDQEPSAMVVIDTKVEKNAIKEARVRGIKVVGIVDTNCDPDIIDFPVPANDDAIKSISLFLDVLVQSFSNSSTSIDLAGKRNDYVSKLNKMERDAQEEEESRKREEELQKKRLKEMKESAGKVIRVVKKGTEKKIKSSTDKK